MTIEQKALELVNAVRWQCDWFALTAEEAERDGREFMKALCRALEAHEADKARHAAEMREQAERFSEAAGKVVAGLRASPDGNLNWKAGLLEPFILVPVDPLYEALKAVVELGRYDTAEQTQLLRGELDARGLAIVKKEAVNG